MNSWTYMSEGGGMSYQRYSVDPLLALNKETGDRITQLRSDLDLVRGCTVLDVGTYAGLAAMVCLEAGAKSVCGADVDDSFFLPISNWSRERGKPITLINLGFGELNSDHKADVVLLLEVYHWLSHQGLSAIEVANKLNILARSHIVIETPYDGTDPSVQRVETHAVERYQPSELLDTLVRLGWKVEFRGLCSYFPKEYKRARFICSRSSNMCNDQNN